MKGEKYVKLSEVEKLIEESNKDKMKFVVMTGELLNVIKKLPTYSILSRKDIERMKLRRVPEWADKCKENEIIDIKHAIYNQAIDDILNFDGVEAKENWDKDQNNLGFIDPCEVTLEFLRKYLEMPGAAFETLMLEVIRLKELVKEPDWVGEGVVGENKFGFPWLDAHLPGKFDLVGQEVKIAVWVIKDGNNNNSQAST